MSECFENMSEMDKLFNAINACREDDFEYTKKVLRLCAKHIQKLENKNSQYSKVYSAQWKSAISKEWEFVKSNEEIPTFETAEDASNFLDNRLAIENVVYSENFLNYAKRKNKRNSDEINKHLIIETRIISRYVSDWEEVEHQYIEPIKASKLKEKEDE